jgi:CPA2 family monovalent cation:H+ antiporter-2
MTGWDLLFDIAVLIAGALILGLLCEKLRINALLGYILSGAVLGPEALGVIRGPNAIETISEIGVALLLYSIGLEFSRHRLKKLGKVALLGGTAQIVLTTVVVALIAQACGVATSASWAVGAVVALSSTAIVIRTLDARNEVDSLHGRYSVGILLMQDIALVPIVAVVTWMGSTAVTSTTQVTAAPLRDVVWNTTLLMVGLVVVVGFLLPLFLRSKTIGRNRDFIILIAIVTCLAATYAAHSAGLSPALGAFLAGVILAENQYADQIRVDIEPFKTLFVTLFFASVGMLVNFQYLSNHIWLVLACLVGVFLLKTTITFATVKPFGTSTVASFATGLALAQVGEFGFMITGIARSSGLFDKALADLVVSVSVISLLLASFVVPNAGSWGRSMAIRLYSSRVLAKQERDSRPRIEGHIIVVGYGDAGRACCSQLAARGYTVLAMEIHASLARLAEERGHLSRLGDATQQHSLELANIEHAKGVVIAIPDVQVAMLIVNLVKRIAPHVWVVSRSRYSSAAKDIDVLGADAVIDEEKLTGVQLAVAANQQVQREILGGTDLTDDRN